MPQAIIFDLLTALLDSWTLWNVAAGSPQKGHEWRTHYLHLTFNCGAYRPYADLIREAAKYVPDLPEIIPDTLLSEWDGLQPWPEAIGVLHGLKKRGYKVGIVSNCSVELGRQAVSRLGHDVVDAFITAEEVGFYKPHPSTYARILSALHITQPQDAIFVAGSSGDVIGAADVGMQVYWHNRAGLAALPGSAPVGEAKSLRVLLREFVGCKGLRSDEIPTPAVFLNWRVYQGNCERMHERVKGLGVQMRVHIKTHKTVEGTRLEVAGGGGGGRIACSTLKEIEHVEELTGTGEVSNVLYAIPPAKSHLPRLASLRRRLNTELILMIDHPSQIDLLHNYTSTNAPWPIFISVDCGDHREGIQLTSPRQRGLIQHAINSDKVYIYGLYTHAGHSYSANSQSEAEAHLRNEIEHVQAAARICHELTNSKPNTNPPNHGYPLTLSVGATPTAQAARKTAIPPLDPNTSLELHAGNFAILDLQQAATNIPSLSQIASWIEAEVLSVYPERGEVLINLGALGIGREPGREKGVWGVAKIVTSDSKSDDNGYDWNLVRISQEHGILAPRENGAGAGAWDSVVVGTRVRVLPQHACIAGAMHESYIVVDEEGGECVEEWARCRGW